MMKLKNPQSTFINGDDSPLPGGDAKGLWNLRPEMPLRKCGIPLAKNRPAMK